MNLNNVINTYELMYFSDSYRTIFRQNTIKFQTKTTFKKIYLLYYLLVNDYLFFIPYLRSNSEEITENALNIDIKNAQTIIYRKVIYYDEKTKIRISLQENCNVKGSSFFFTAEQEYDYLKINNLIQFERKFFETVFKKTKGLENINFLNNVDDCNLFDLLSFKPRKFNTFIDPILEKNTKLYKKLKLDGYRAYIMNNKKNELFYYDTSNNMTIIESNMLDDYNKIIFQLEIVKNYWIITDVVGVKIKSVQYMPEPFISELIINDINLKSSNICHKDKIFQVLKQKLVLLLKPNDKLLSLPHDGYILISPTKILKLKLPTLDIRYLSGYFILDDVEEVISKYNNEYGPLVENGIYETVIYKEFIFIWRQRFDRHFTSNIDDYNSFLKQMDEKFIYLFNKK